MAEEDAETGSAEGAGGVDVFAVADGHDLGSDEAGVAGPSANGERENEIGEAGTEKGGKGNGEEDAGQRLKGVHEKCGESGVDPSAEVAGEAADGEAERKRDGDDSNRDGERETRAPEQAGSSI